MDANLNRAREGLRVLEDTARFVWDDRSLFEAFRRARHRLDRLTRAAYPRLVSSRDSAADMGRRMGEVRRRTAEGLVAANFRRVEEALRVLEEYGKLLSPRSAAAFKALRFRLYIAEKTVFRHAGKGAGSKNK
jgi:thiamine-phosphate pyrophosphorylase